jgi:hypothetical protein
LVNKIQIRAIKILNMGVKMKIVGSKYKKTIQRPLNMIGKNEHKEIS